MKRVQTQTLPASTGPVVSTLGLAKRVTTKDKQKTSETPAADIMPSSPSAPTPGSPHSHHASETHDVQISQSQRSIQSSQQEGPSLSQSSKALKKPTPKTQAKPGPLLAASIRKGLISIGSKSKVNRPAALAVRRHKSSKHNKRSTSTAEGDDDDASETEASISAFGRRNFLHVEKEEEYSMQSLPIGDKGEPLWLNEDTMMPRQSTVMDFSKYETEIGCRMCLAVPAYEEFMLRYASC